MKGMVLEYPFTLALVVVVIMVAIGIVLAIMNQFSVKPPSFPTDVRYSCIQFNNTNIRFDDLRIVLYGFLTDQCNNFTASLIHTVGMQDLQRVANEIDKSIKVINITECKLPNFDTHTLYLCCKQELDRNEVFNITRKEIKNSDVLICEE